MSADEVKDQLNAEPGAGGGEESGKDFETKFEAGWKKYEEEQTLAKPAPKPEGGKAPYKVLKVGGKEVPVFSKQELAEKIAEMYGEEDKMVDLGQLSQDYTRKRQADAADRKRWEDEYKSKADELNAMGKRYTEIVNKLRAKGVQLDENGEPFVGKPKEEPARREDGGERGGEGGGDELTEAFKRYNLDPEFAQDHERELIKDVTTMRKQMGDMQKLLDQSGQALRYFQVREVVQEMARVIDDERKTSPFEDIVGEDGKSLTFQEFQGMLAEKLKAVSATGKRPDLEKLTREAIREISTKQSRTKEAVELSDDMSPEDFAKKYPKLAAKFGKAAGAEALDKHAEKESKLPPTLDRKSREVDLKRQPASKEGPRGMAEQLEAAFADADILSSLPRG